MLKRFIAIVILFASSNCFGQTFKQYDVLRLYKKQLFIGYNITLIIDYKENKLTDLIVKVNGNDLSNGNGIYNIKVWDTNPITIEVLKKMGWQEFSNTGSYFYSTKNCG